MNIIRVVATAPLYPISFTAAYGRTSPAVTSSALMRWETSRVNADTPIVVAQSHGIANQQSPPMTYPGKACTGCAAMASRISVYIIRAFGFEHTFVVVSIVEKNSAVD